MIHILLDTSTLREHINMHKASFVSLTRLCNEEFVRVHIPFLVRDELVSQVPEISKPFKRIIKGIGETKRLNHTSSDFTKLVKIETDIKRMRNRFEKRLEQNFNQWTEEINAEFHEFRKNHAKSVFEGYFNGSLPFKEKKNRNDIPDAFIFETVKDLVKKHKNMYAVVGDKTLFESIDGVDDVSAFKTLEGFIKDPKLQEIVSDAFSKKYFNEIVELLNANQNVLEDELQHQEVKSLEGKTVNSSSILGDMQEGTIYGVGGAYDYEFFVSDSDYYGDGVIILPYSFSVNCELTSYMFIADYYGLDEERLDKVSASEWNDHYYEIEEEFELNVNAQLSVTIPFDIDNIENIDLLELVKKSEVSIDTIDSISIEFKKGYDDHGDYGAYK